MPPLLVSEACLKALPTEVQTAVAEGKWTVALDIMVKNRYFIPDELINWANSVMPRLSSWTWTKTVERYGRRVRIVAREQRSG